jgi:hypothetical protein
MIFRKTRWLQSCLRARQAPAEVAKPLTEQGPPALQPRPVPDRPPVRVPGGLAITALQRPEVERIPGSGDDNPDVGHPASDVQDQPWTPVDDLIRMSNMTRANITEKKNLGFGSVRVGSLHSKKWNMLAIKNYNLYLCCLLCSKELGS